MKRSSDHTSPKQPSSASKKNKIGQQADLTSFFASPSSKSNEKQPAPTKEVISLCSDDEDEDLKPVASTSKSTNGSAKKHTKQEEQPDVKPRMPGNPSLTLGANTSTSATPLDQVQYPIERDLFGFDPAQDIDTASWPKAKTDSATAAAGDIVIPYAFLSGAFAKISSTKSRLEITTLMSNTLRTVIHYQPAALLPTIYLITNHVAPAYEGVELGVGSQVLSASLKSVSGVSASRLRSLWNKHGDPGDVAFEAKSSVRTLVPTAPLTIVGVHATFLQIASLKGQGVTNKKSGLVNKMLVAARGEETRFIVRSLCANLRIGAVRLTVTSSLARAFCLHQGACVAKGEYGMDPENKSRLAISLAECQGVKAVAQTAKQGKDDPRRRQLMSRLAEAEAIVRKVYVRHPNYDDIVSALLKDDVGLEGLEEAVPLQVGTPINNMLGQITRSLDDVSQRFSESTEFAAEFKYDGQRIQIHARRRNEQDDAVKKDVQPTQGKQGHWIGPEKDLYVRLFSRHLEDMTEKYPDVHQVVYHMFERSKTNGYPLDSFIVDAEIVAIDGPTGKLLDFQTLATRARKDVAIGDVRVRAKIFAFDLMYLNGEPLLSQTFRERRDKLHAFLQPYEDETDPTLARFGHVESMVGTPGDLGPVEEFFHRALGSKCEGIMVKILDHEVLVKHSLDAVKKEEEDAGEEAVEPAADQTTLDALVKPETDAQALDASESKSATKAPQSPNKKSRKMLLPASYEPDKRADAWLKVKKDYAETGGDSLDLVPIAVWHGQGRKAGWWSPILLAVYNSSNDHFSAVCKCISGFSDQFYKDLNERYPKGTDMCFKKRPSNVDPGIQPDWYLKPSEVWEIRGADISLSPVYPAARGLLPGERGLSLRFPRFMKLRGDKSIEQATTPNDFVDAYHRQQASSQGNGGQAKGNGDSNKSTNTSQQKPMTASGGTGAEGESEGYDEYPSEEDVLDEL